MSYITLILYGGVAQEILMTISTTLLLQDSFSITKLEKVKGHPIFLSFERLKHYLEISDAISNLFRVEFQKDIYIILKVF